MAKNFKFLLIGFVAVLVLGFIGFQNYKMIESQNIDYREQRKIDEKNSKNAEPKSKVKKRVLRLDNVYTYSSSLNDKEINGEIIQTNRELTIHTFDFDNKIITMKSMLNGKWIEIKYPYHSMYKEKGLYATTIVVKVGTLGVREIWWNSEFSNLGYDFMDGSRIACYEIELQ